MGGRVRGSVLSEAIVAADAEGLSKDAIDRGILSCTSVFFFLFAQQRRLSASGFQGFGIRDLDAFWSTLDDGSRCLFSFLGTRLLDS